MRRAAQNTGDYTNNRLNASWDQILAQRMGVGGDSYDAAVQYLEQQSRRNGVQFRDPGRVTQFLRGMANRIGIGV